MSHRYTDLMIDLETLGNRPGDIVKQVGLCAFDISDPSTGVKATNVHINIDSAQDYGLRVQGSTLQYWLGESEGARKVMCVRGEALPVALRGVLDFVEESIELVAYTNEEGTRAVAPRVWGYGSSYDIAILEAAFHMAGLPLPWGHRSPHCLRTLSQLASGVDRPNPSVPHVAQEDAVAQALWAQNIFRFLDLEGVAPPSWRRNAGISV